jgi:hypothetical protein
MSPKPAGPAKHAPATPEKDPEDEFDPDLFNRQAHPDRKPSPGG